MMIGGSNHNLDIWSPSFGSELKSDGTRILKWVDMIVEVSFLFID